MKVNPSRKVRISLNIDPKILRRLDILCTNKDLSRSQVIELIFSTDDATVDFMMEQIKRIDSVIGF